MGEKADLQGQKLYVMLFMLFFMYWTGERYLNLGTAKKGSLNLKHGLKNMMFWKRGSVFVSTEKESLRVYLGFMWFESPRPPEML